MSNYSHRRLMRARETIKQPGLLPIGARYAAIWHLDRLNNVLNPAGLKVVRDDRPDGEIKFDVIEVW